MTGYIRVITWRAFGPCPVCGAPAKEPCRSRLRRPENQAAHMARWAHPGRPKGLPR